MRVSYTLEEENHMDLLSIEPQKPTDSCFNWIVNKGKI